MAFTCRIATGNAAFEPEPHAELARLLRKIARELERCHDSHVIVDANGNTCGEWEITGHDSD